jgi:hypothetical protein
MQHYPMVLKTQCESSLAISLYFLKTEKDLQEAMTYRVRNYFAYNFEGKRLTLNWWLIRQSDDVVLAQSKGYRP